MAHKQDRQFPPADQLIEEIVASTGMNFALPHGFLNGKRNRHRPDIAEVQIRRRDGSFPSPQDGSAPAHSPPTPLRQTPSAV